MTLDKWLLNQLEELLRERLLSMQITEEKVEIGNRIIKVSVKAKFQMPVFTTVFEKLKIWNYQCTEKAVRVWPINFIRGVRKQNGNEL